MELTQEDIASETAHSPLMALHASYAADRVMRSLAEGGGFFPAAVCANVNGDTDVQS